MSVLKIASRDIWRRKARACLVILALGLSIAILIAIPAATRAYSDATKTTLEAQRSAYESTITMMATEIIVEAAQPTSVPIDLGGGKKIYTYIGVLDEGIAENITLMSGVEAVVPELQNIVPLQGITMAFPYVRVVGIPLDPTLNEKYYIQPVNIVSGRRLNEKDSRGVLLGLDLAEALGVGVGQSIDLRGHTFTVVGIFDAGNMRGNREAYVSLEEAQMMFDWQGIVTQIGVFAESVEDVNYIVDQIESAYGDSLSTTTQEGLVQDMPRLFQELEAAVASQLAQMEAVASMETLIAIVAGGLIVFLTMIYTIRERTKEIGILKALGFTNWNIMSQFMLTGAIIGLVGGLAGCIIGSFGAPLLSRALLPSPDVSLPTGSTPIATVGQPLPQLTVDLITQVMPDASLILLGLGVAVLLGVLGSLYPSWWASRKRPAEALRYE